VVWFWSVDLIKAFNNLHYNRLINEIEKTIDDFMLMRELRKMFKIRIIDFKITANDFSLSTPQSIVISAFLRNIYLTSLDKFVRNFTKKYEKVSSSILNPSFRHIIFMGKAKFKFERNSIVSKYTKTNYIRYGDDILFGLNTNKSLAKKIIESIRTFIKSDLHLNCYTDNFKSKLCHGSSELSIFLGFKIGLYSTNYCNKSKHLIRFYKFKANIQRKKVMESEKYYKMQENILSKLHRNVISSIAVSNQTLINSFRSK
jgi:hypothetical protein